MKGLEGGPLLLEGLGPDSSALPLNPAVRGTWINTKCVPALQILSKDSVTVAVDAVVYYRVFEPVMSVLNVENVHRATRLLAQTTLRNVLGTKSLSEILSDRENISHFMQASPGRAVGLVCLYVCVSGAWSGPGSGTDHAA